MLYATEKLFCVSQEQTANIQYDVTFSMQRKVNREKKFLKLHPVQTPCKQYLLSSA